MSTYVAGLGLQYLGEPFRGGLLVAQLLLDGRQMQVGLVVVGIDLLEERFALPFCLCECRLF